jgi:hypothetical protein
MIDGARAPHVSPTDAPQSASCEQVFYDDPDHDTGPNAADQKSRCWAWGFQGRAGAVNRPASNPDP